MLLDSFVLIPALIGSADPDRYCLQHEYPYFGNTVACAGDIDGDGKADVLIADPGGTLRWDGRHDHRGIVWVVSGTTGKEIARCESTKVDDCFGVVLAGNRDIDKDGVPDWLISAPSLGAEGTGRVEVYSGRCGEILMVLKPHAPDGFFGFGVRFANDVDRDGYDDILVGTPATHPIGDGAGYLEIFSGRDGSSIARIGLAPNRLEHLKFRWILQEQLWFGDQIEVLPDSMDLRGGAREVLLRRSLIPSEFVCQCLQRPLPAGLRRSGDLEDQWEGGIAVRVFDIDDDGVEDCAVGYSEYGIAQGAVCAYSGATGTLLYSIVDPEQDHEDVWHLGSALADLPDNDGDACTDLVVGMDHSISHYPEEARLYSGKTGRPLRRWTRDGDRLRAFE